MARRLKDLKELKIERPPRIKLSAKESLKRTKEFDKRKESFICRCCVAERRMTLARSFKAGIRR